MNKVFSNTYEDELCLVLCGLFIDRGSTPIIVIIFAILCRERLLT